MPIPDGSVVITPGQMYTELQAMRKSVDNLATTVDPALNEIRRDVSDHETRMRIVEARYVSRVSVAWLAGTAIALLGLLVTFLSFILAK